MDGGLPGPLPAHRPVPTESQAWCPAPSAKPPDPPPTFTDSSLQAEGGPSPHTPPRLLRRALDPGPGTPPSLLRLLLSLLRSCRSSCSWGPTCSWGTGVSMGSCGQGGPPRKGARSWRVSRGSGEAEGRLGGWGLSARPPQGRGARTLPSWTPPSEAAGLRRTGDGAGAGGAAGRAAWAPAGAPPRAAGPPAGPWAGAEGRARPRGAWGGLRAHRGGPLSLPQAPWATAGHCRGLSSVTVVPRGSYFQLPFHGGGGGGQVWNQVGLDHGGCAQKDPPDSRHQAFPLTLFLGRGCCHPRAGAGSWEDGVTSPAGEHSGPCHLLPFFSPE